MTRYRVERVVFKNEYLPVVVQSLHAIPQGVAALARRYVMEYTGCNDEIKLLPQRNFPRIAKYTIGICPTRQLQTFMRWIAANDPSGWECCVQKSGAAPGSAAKVKDGSCVNGSSSLHQFNLITRKIFVVRIEKDASGF